MQMNHICLIELGECGNVCTRVGNVDSKKIMFFKSVCFPDDDALPDELPYFPPRFFQLHHTDLVSLLIADKHLGFYTIVLQGFHQAVGCNGGSSYSLRRIDDKYSHVH